MKDLINITAAELTKYIKLKSVVLGITALIVIILGVSINEFIDNKKFQENKSYEEEVMSWQEREENIIKYGTESLSDEWYDAFEKDQIQRRIDIAKYRLENDLPSNIYKNMWWFFNDNAFDWVIRLVIAIIILAGAINIGKEYTDKTMTQMLLLPFKRWKILLSKLCAMIVFALALFLGVLILGIISGLLIHGTSGMNAKVVLNNGAAIRTISMTTYSLLIILTKVVEVIFYVALTCFLSVLIRSGAVAAVIGILTALLLTPASIFVSKYYSIFNYSPLNNLDFRRYLDFGRTMPAINSDFQNVVISGITPVISALIVAGTIAILILISFYSFQKRDVK